MTKRWRCAIIGHLQYTIRHHSQFLKSSAGTGVWVGELSCLLIGAAFIWVAGFGPLIVAGPLAAALLGGIEGAIAGAAGRGLLGALVGRGVSREHVPRSEETLKKTSRLLFRRRDSRSNQVPRPIVVSGRLGPEYGGIE